MTITKSMINIMHKTLSAILFATLSSAVHADSEWIEIAGDDTGGRWHMKAGSLEISQTKAKVAIAVVIGRVTGVISKQVLLYKWYVPLKDCVAENGIVVALNLSGDYQFENEFVFGADNIASSMAEAICGAASRQAHVGQ